MLAVRIVEDSEVGGALPDACSLCGRPADHCLVTPWDHLDVCDDCSALACHFFDRVNIIRVEANFPCRLQKMADLHANYS